MESGLSPTVIAGGLGVLAVVAIAVFLVVGRRKDPAAGSGSSSELLRLEQPQSPRRVPARPAPAAPQQPLPQPPEPVSVVEDPELARVHERARRRARTVVREIMMYNEEKLEKGRKEGNVAKYLTREIEVSRKLYQASIDLSDAESARYFDESLLNILAAGDASLLKE